MTPREVDEVRDHARHPIAAAADRGRQARVRRLAAVRGPEDVLGAEHQRLQRVAEIVAEDPDEALPHRGELTEKLRHVIRDR
ncbi:MAG: hypothetical protein M3680_18430 [Myxococcota bacterium]|nr:hypothetical protein [Myxococcota bacterium]